MIGPIELFFAFFLDLAIGDPLWLPHPGIIGRAVKAAEHFLRSHFTTPSEERWAGVLLVMVIVIPVSFITLGIHRAAVWFSDHVSMVPGMVVLVYLTATIRGIGIGFFGSDANFYLLRTERAGQVYEGLRRKGILVRDCSNFAGLDERYIRVAVRSRKENGILLRGMEEIMKGTIS
jgi:hypothetical protein